MEQRITKVEEKVNHLEHDVCDLRESTKDIPTIKYMMKEYNENQNEQTCVLKELSSAISSLNLNISILNRDIQHQKQETDNRFQYVEDAVHVNKKKIETIQDSQNINWVVAIKNNIKDNIIPYLFGICGAGGVVYTIIQHIAEK